MEFAELYQSLEYVWNVKPKDYSDRVEKFTKVNAEDAVTLHFLFLPTSVVIAT